MATARSEQVDLSVTPYYHCMARCVRRAFLCGDDNYSGNNFDHRKEWVRARLRFIATVFAIDVCAYAAMSNHLHVVLHVDEERGAGWSTQEVVRRYTALYPNTKAHWEAKISAEQRRNLVTLWRSRLCSISWFMRALNEHIARKANNEDKTEGRFWEGRFKSQAILDESGLLASMAYVDLNPVRAGIADSLEGSDFTSIQERLKTLAQARQQKRELRAPRSLAPMLGQAASGDATRALPMVIAEYVSLLEWTGSALVPGKRGKLKVAPTILSERGISSEGWLEAMSGLELGTVRFLGSVNSLKDLAAARGRKSLRGIGLARRLAA